MTFGMMRTLKGSVFCTGQQSGSVPLKSRITSHDSQAENLSQILQSSPSNGLRAQSLKQLVRFGNILSPASVRHSVQTKLQNSEYQNRMSLCSVTGRVQFRSDHSTNSMKMLKDLAPHKWIPDNMHSQEQASLSGNETKELQCWAVQE